MSVVERNVSNDNLVDYLVAIKALKTDTIIAAFREVDRRFFLPSEFAQSGGDVYGDKPLKKGLVHQSAPHM
jgi:protein-L-isoaspartate O-methyltransferase